MKEITLKIPAEEYAAVSALASAARQSPEAWALSAIRKAQKKAKEDAELLSEDVSEAYNFLIDEIRCFSGKFANECFSLNQFLAGYANHPIAVLRSKRVLKKALKRLIENEYVHAYVEEWGETKYHTHDFNTGRWAARDIGHKIMRQYDLSYPDWECIEQTLYADAPMKEHAPIYLDALSKSAVDVLAHLHNAGKTKLQKGRLRCLLADFLTPHLKRDEIFQLLAFEHYHKGRDLFAPVIAGLVARGALVDIRGYYHLPPVI